MLYTKSRCRCIIYLVVFVVGWPSGVFVFWSVRSVPVPVVQRRELVVVVLLQSERRQRPSPVVRGGRSVLPLAPFRAATATAVVVVDHVTVVVHRTVVVTVALHDQYVFDVHVTCSPVAQCYRICTDDAWNEGSFRLLILYNIDYTLAISTQAKRVDDDDKKKNNMIYTREYAYENK